MPKTISPKSKNLKVAVIHDFLTEYGGAEKVLEAILEIYPNADVYTTEFWPEKFPAKYQSYNIKTGFIAKLPFHKLLFQQYKLFHIFFFEKLKLNSYDLVISDSSGFAKGVVVNPRVPNISYIHTPPRFLWGMESARHHKLNIFYKIVLGPIEHFWRIWDYNAAGRPDILIANSKVVQERIRKIYHVESSIINPPVEINDLPFAKDRDSKKPSFFVVSRLVKYKRVDLIIEAFKQLPYDLYISGTGEEDQELKALAAGHDNIYLLGRATDEERNKYLTTSYATIFAGAEDFGIVMVESLAAGTPVIAYKKDGATEIVEENKNGVFFEEQSVSAIIKAVEKALKTKFDSSTIRRSSEKFSKESFKEKFIKLVEKTIEDKSKYTSENISNR